MEIYTVPEHLKIEVNLFSNLFFRDFFSLIFFTSQAFKIRTQLAKLILLWLKKDLYLIDLGLVEKIKIFSETQLVKRMETKDLGRKILEVVGQQLNKVQKILFLVFFQKTLQILRRKYLFIFVVKTSH